MASNNNSNPKATPVPVVSRQLQITNPDGTPTRSGMLLLQQLESISVMGASGPSHAAGLVPDPGATAGTTRFLREDGTWALPGGAGGGGLSDPTTTTGDLIVRGPTQYTDLQIVIQSNIVYSAAHPFTAGDVGSQITITAGTGFTPGTYTMTSLVYAANGTPTSNMILSANVGTVGSTGGVGSTTKLTRLGVGTNGQVLTADSTQSLGIKWATAGGGSQTPWLSNIDAAGYNLNNVANINGVVSGPSITFAGQYYLQLHCQYIQNFADGGFYVFNTAGSVTYLAIEGGNVGIKMRGPAYSLDVSGDVNCSGVYRINGTPLVTGVSSVFGRTGAVVATAGDYTAAQVTNAVDQTATYTNPAWIVSIPWSKISGAPAFLVSPLTTKGDLMVYGTGNARLGVGTNGQVLTADSTQTLGLKWATPAAGAGQTPWLSNIDGGGFALSNTSQVSITTSSSIFSLNISASATLSAQAMIICTNSAGGGGLAVQNDLSHIGYLTMEGSTVGGSWGDTLVLQTASAQPMVLATNGLERMRINSAGNVGIGNDGTNPAGAVQNTLALGNSTLTTPAGFYVVSNQGASTSAPLGNFNWANFAIAASDKRVAYINGDLDGAINSGMIRFFTSSAGTLGERMRIRSNGYAGIGQTAPIAQLHLLGLGQNNTGLATAAGQNLGGTVILQDSGTLGNNGGAAIFGASQGNFAAIKGCLVDGANNTRGDLSFEVRKVNTDATLTDVLHIMSSGNVGIGMTNPANLLQLSADSAGKPATNTWTIVSDGRVKRNIRAFTHGLATLLRFKPIAYEYNGQNGTPDGLSGVGLIAQEAAEVYEPCIRKMRGAIDGRETEVLWTNTSDLAFMMLNALKEIDHRLRQLEAN